MNELLYDLYEKLYTPLAMSSQKAKIYECHRQLIEVLDKPERKLLLTIMDQAFRRSSGVFYARGKSENRNLRKDFLRNEKKSA